MANKAFVAKNGLTVNTASVIMSQLSGTLTQASGGENLTLDENGQLGTQTNAQIKSNIGAGVVETITAGNGLTGGGTNATVAVALGTPTTLTVSTTDTVGAATHAHAITTSSDVTGGTAAILASDGTGKLEVATLNAGTSLEIGGTAVSSNAGELNLVDGSSAGTVVNSKAVIYGSSGEVNATTLQIGGTSITATATELNLLDGVSGLVQADFTKLAAVDATATELNILDGDTSASPSVTIADADRFVLNDAGTMKQIAATDVAAYVGANPADFSSNILPNASGTIDLGSATKEFNDIFLADSSVIKFGSDQEILLTHNADKGLTLKHNASGDDKFPTFTLAAGDNDIAADDVIGAIDFVAPDEGTGTDAITTAGSIRVISEGDFAADNNASKMSFMLGSSGAASEVMSLSSAGALTISGNLIVSGTTTTVSSTTIEVNDPLLFLAQNNTSTDAVDIGFFGTYDDGGTDKFAGLFRDANDGKFKFFKDNQAEPTSTVDTGGTGYTAATVVAGTFEGNLTGNVTGNINGDLTGTLQTAAQPNVTSLGTLTTLTVDNVIVNGTTIGHTSDTDLMTLANGGLTIDGTVTVGANDAGFDVILYGETASANMTWDASADDLILNGAAGLVVPDGQLTLGSTAVTATAAEINLIDGDASVAAGAAVADGDGLLLNDAGTMRMTTVQNLAAYFDDEITAMPNLVQSGALDAGSITSGFGTIDTGSSTITTSGVLTGGSVVVTNESTIGSASDTDAIRIGAGGSVAFSNNTVLYGATNTSVAVASTQTFSGTIGTSATEVVFTFKAKDGTASPTGATNYQGGEIVLTLKKGTDVETKKIMIHHDGDPSADGTDIFITEFATLGTELGETLTTSMGDADGTSLTTNGDKHVHFKIQNPSGTDAMTYAGVAHLVEIPGDS